MAIRLVPGNQIQSQNVNAQKTYVDGRNLDNLRRLGALQGVESDVAERVDGIIDNQPPNGATSIDELVRVEQPEYKATLFAEEQQAQPSLWKHLEWETNVAPAQPAPTLPPLASTVQDASVGPGTFDFTQPVAIGDLPAELQKTARRVQLVLNTDNDASTIQVQDLERGIAEPGRFTQRDLAEMKQLVEVVKAKLRGAGELAARAFVPMPGRIETALPHAGQLGLTFVVDHTIRESRSASEASHGNSHFHAQMMLVRESNIKVDVPGGHQALLINHETGEERLFTQSETARIPAGTWRVELWKDGARLESSDVNLPVTGAENHDITAFLDHELGTPNHTLHRVLVSASDQRQRHSPYGTQYTAAYEYRSEAPSSPPPQEQVQAAAKTETPMPSLRPGRYQIEDSPWGPLSFDVYPQRVMKLAIGGETKTMKLRGMSGGLMYENGNDERTPQRPRAVFNHNNAALTVYTNAHPRHQINVTITDAMRVG